LGQADGKLYFTDFAAGGILRSDLDGSNLVALAGATEPWGLELDLSSNRLYFTEAAQFNDNPSISVVNLDSFEVENLFLNNLDNPRHIALIPEPSSILLLAAGALLTLAATIRRPPITA
jgi:hypothetical protein